MNFKSKSQQFLRKLSKTRPFTYGLNKKKCTECMACEAVCPTKAIDLVALPESRQNVQKKQSHKNIYKFYMDLSQCIHCHACIDICESKALFVCQGEVEPVLEKSKLKQNLMLNKKLT